MSQLKQDPQAARDWLDQLMDYEKRRRGPYNEAAFNLQRMETLLASLGQPQDQVPLVHIAGSKGKGSTVTMLASILTEGGYTVGAFMSPHVMCLEERIAIGRQMIGAEALDALIQQVREIVEATESLNGHVTVFEVLTAVAIKYFADEAVDIAIIETGLGGRLDSTNVIQPILCGITSISLDHTQWLGDTIEAIAAEKAGIIKKGVPVVVADQKNEAVSAVFDERAAEVGAPITMIGRDLEVTAHFQNDRQIGPHYRFSLINARQPYDHIPVPLLGEHQVMNCAVAIAMVDQLATMGFEISTPVLVDGLSRTVLPGRMEVVIPQPRVLVDGAHNAASIACLMRTIGNCFTYDSLVVVFGCTNDKDVEAMCRELDMGADKVILTRAASSRSVEPLHLKEVFGQTSERMVQVADTVEEALVLAGQAVGHTDLICVTGSFYLVGEVKQYIEKRKRQAAKA